MVPAALLTLVGLGLVLAYVIPQRIKERSDYALVRTEDRYSDQMRVVRATAARMERSHTRPSTNSGEVPLLVTGSSRAQIAALGDQRMSRPAGPLERAAVSAQREAITLRGDRAVVLNERKATARRRARVASAAGLLALAAWVAVIFSPFSVVAATLISTAFGGIVVAGARAASAQRNAHLHMVAREVEAAATATQALRRVSAARARGVEAEPSDVETQAIRVVTTADLAPLAAPAPLPAPELPVVDVEPELSSDWTPKDLPAPAYTLKASVRPQYARPLTADDYAASSYAAPAASAAVPDEADAEASPMTGQLDAILARRRRASA
jgi:hypothetical protein